MYQPNSFNGTADDAGFSEPPLRIDGNAARYDHRVGDNYYTQAANLYRLMDPAAQQRLIDNIVAAMQSVPRDIQVRQVAHFTKADSAYGAGITEGMGVPPV